MNATLTSPWLRRRPREALEASLALSVWVRLLKVHGLLLRRVRRGVPQGLTLPQLDVLVHLYRRPDGMRATELTRKLLVTAGNITGIVDRLSRLGLVERRSDPADRRVVLLCLTARGRKRVERVVPAHHQEVDRILSAVPRESLVRLRDLLGHVGNNLETRA